MSFQAVEWARRQNAGSPTTKCVLLLLAGFANDRGSCIRVQKDIALGCEMSIHSVQRHLKILENLRMIIRFQAFREDQTSLGHEYVLPIDADAQAYIISKQLAISPSMSGDSFLKPSSRLKERCIWAFGFTCQYCKRAGNHEADPDGRFWELDRITPGVHGGNYHPANITLACKACNASKADEIPAFPPQNLSHKLGEETR